MSSMGTTLIVQQERDLLSISEGQRMGSLIIFFGWSRTEGGAQGFLALESAGEAQRGGKKEVQFLAITLSNLMAPLDSVVTWEKEASLNDWRKWDYFWAELQRIGSY